MDGLVRYFPDEADEPLHIYEIELLTKREGKLKRALTALLFINLACVSGAVTLLTLLFRQ